MVPAVTDLIRRTQGKEDTFTTFEKQTWLPDFILGINPFRICCAWPVWAAVSYHLGKNKVVSSVSIDRHFNIKIIAWHKLGMHTKLQKIGNKTIKYTGSYFTAVEVSSEKQLEYFICKFQTHDQIYLEYSGSRGMNAKVSRSSYVNIGSGVGAVRLT